VIRAVGRKRGRRSSDLLTRAPERDRETGDRLLQEAARLFAARGFSKVTVRDIALKAHANVAAVNYHFGDKAALYDAVLEAAIHEMQTTTEAARQAGAGRPPDEQLATYIAVFLGRVFEGRNSWIHQLMVREISDPTPALDRIVDRVLRPRVQYLRDIVAALMDGSPDDDRVTRCVISVHTQCLAVMNNPVAPRLGLSPVATAAGIQEIARHIAKFSLAGIRAIAKDRSR
jgi:TetR/AcrR family transcriptional regulator, regulator of cefoperazone and chloramphenicol sensitivity